MLGTLLNFVTDSLYTGCTFPYENRYQRCFNNFKLMHASINCLIDGDMGGVAEPPHSVVHYNFAEIVVLLNWTIIPQKNS